MRHENDPNKRRKNLRKHAIDFGEAESVFADPLLETVYDVSHSDDEPRFLTFGTSQQNRLLCVVHTDRIYQDGVEAIRIISAREATPREKAAYAEGIV